MTLTEFLLARIAEDEERAEFVRRQNEGSWTSDFETWKLSWHDEYDLLCIEPKRALAECEAKRCIVEWHKPLKSPPGFTPNCEGCWEDGGEDGAPLWPCRNVRWLALPYADHPDFDEAWRP